MESMEKCSTTPAETNVLKIKDLSEENIDVNHQCLKNTDKGHVNVPTDANYVKKIYSPEKDSKFIFFNEKDWPRKVMRLAEDSLQKATKPWPSRPLSSASSHEKFHNKGPREKSIYTCKKSTTKLSKDDKAHIGDKETATVSKKSDKEETELKDQEKTNNIVSEKSDLKTMLKELDEKLTDNKFKTGDSKAEGGNKIIQKKSSTKTIKKKDTRKNETQKEDKVPCGVKCNKYNSKEMRSYIQAKRMERKLQMMEEAKKKQAVIDMQRKNLEKLREKASKVLKKNSAKGEERAEEIKPNWQGPLAEDNSEASPEAIDIFEPKTIPAKKSRSKVVQDPPKTNIRTISPEKELNEDSDKCNNNTGNKVTDNIVNELIMDKDKKSKNAFSKPITKLQISKNIFPIEFSQGEKALEQAIIARKPEIEKELENARRNIQSNSLGVGWHQNYLSPDSHQQLPKDNESRRNTFEVPHPAVIPGQPAYDSVGISSQQKRQQSPAASDHLSAKKICTNETNANQDSLESALKKIRLRLTSENDGKVPDLLQSLKPDAFSIMNTIKMKILTSKKPGSSPERTPWITKKGVAPLPSVEDETDAPSITSMEENSSNLPDPLRLSDLHLPISNRSTSIYGSLPHSSPSQNKSSEESIVSLSSSYGNIAPPLVVPKSVQQLKLKSSLSQSDLLYSQSPQLQRSHTSVDLEARKGKENSLSLTNIKRYGDSIHSSRVHSPGNNFMGKDVNDAKPYNESQTPINSGRAHVGQVLSSAALMLQFHAELNRLDAFDHTLEQVIAAENIYHMPRHKSHAGTCHTPCPLSTSSELPKSTDTTTSRVSLENGTASGSFLINGDIIQSAQQSRRHLNHNGENKISLRQLKHKESGHKVSKQFNHKKTSQSDQVLLERPTHNWQNQSDLTVSKLMTHDRFSRISQSVSDLMTHVSQSQSAQTVSEHLSNKSESGRTVSEHLNNNSQSGLSISDRLTNRSESGQTVPEHLTNNSRSLSGQSVSEHLTQGSSSGQTVSGHLTNISGSGQSFSEHLSSKSRSLSDKTVSEQLINESGSGQTVSEHLTNNSQSQSIQTISDHLNNDSGSGQAVSEQLTNNSLNLSRQTISEHLTNDSRSPSYQTISEHLTDGSGSGRIVSKHLTNQSRSYSGQTLSEHLNLNSRSQSELTVSEHLDDHSLDGKLRLNTKHSSQSDLSISEHLAVESKYLNRKHAQEQLPYKSKYVSSQNILKGSILISKSDQFRPDQSPSRSQDTHQEPDHMAAILPKQVVLNSTWDKSSVQDSFLLQETLAVQKMNLPTNSTSFRHTSFSPKTMHFIQMLIEDAEFQRKQHELFYKAQEDILHANYTAALNELDLRFRNTSSSSPKDEERARKKVKEHYESTIAKFLEVRDNVLSNWNKRINNLQIEHYQIKKHFKNKSGSKLRSPDASPKKSKPIRSTSATSVVESTSSSESSVNTQSYDEKKRHEIEDNTMILNQKKLEKELIKRLQKKVLKIHELEKYEQLMKSGRSRRDKSTSPLESVITRDVACLVKEDHDSAQSELVVSSLHSVEEARATDLYNSESFESPESSETPRQPVMINRPALERKPFVTARFNKSKVLIKVPLSPRVQMRAKRNCSSGSDESLALSHNETLSEQSDLEVKISALKEQKRQRYAELNRLQRELKRAQRDQMKATEDALIKQIAVYDSYIAQTKKQLEEVTATKAVKPQIKHPRVSDKFLPWNPDVSLKIHKPEDQPKQQDHITSDIDTNSIKSISEASSIETTVLSSARTHVTEKLSPSSSVQGRISMNNKNEDIETMSTVATDESIISQQSKTDSLTEKLSPSASARGMTSMNYENENVDIMSGIVTDESLISQQSKTDSLETPANLGSENDAFNESQWMDAEDFFNELGDPHKSSFIDKTQNNAEDKVTLSSVSTADNVSEVLTDNTNSSYPDSSNNQTQLEGKPDSFKSEITEDISLRKSNGSLGNDPVHTASVSVISQVPTGSSVSSSSSKVANDLNCPIISPSKTPEPIFKEGDNSIISENGNSRKIDILEENNAKDESISNESSSYSMNDISLNNSEEIVEGSINIQNSSNENLESAEVDFIKVFVSNKNEQVEKNEKISEISQNIEIENDPEYHSNEDKEYSRNIKVNKITDEILKNLINECLNEKNTKNRSTFQNKADDVKAKHIVLANEDSHSEKDTLVNIISDDIVDKYFLEAMDCMIRIRNSHKIINDEPSISEENKAVDNNSNSLITKPETSAAKLKGHEESLSPTSTKANNSREEEINDGEVFWFDEDLQPVSLQTQLEAEELRLKQLQIEQEIKQLEQAQESIPSYFYVREIPNKPPPPYTPPGQSVTKSSDQQDPVPKKQEEVEKLVIIAMQQMFAVYSAGEDLSAVEPSSQYLSGRVGNRAYKKFLFDLAKQCFIDLTTNVNNEKDIPPWEKTGSRIKYVVLPKLTEDFISSYILKKIRILFGFEVDTMRENLIIQWSRKKRDRVDELLVRESQEEEQEWTDYSKCEVAVKNTVSLNILDCLLEDTMSAVNQALAKKQQYCDQHT